MSTSVDFDRERAWWDAKASKEETDSADEAVNRALRWREIERHLEGVDTILDVGGGTGAFSVPLAKLGYDVTHLDISPKMLALAQDKALGVRNIRFIEGNAADLSRFPDRFFDLVLNLDGAISFCGDQAERAILEACRVTRRTLVLTVSHQAWLAAVWVAHAIRVMGAIVPATRAMFDEGRWHQDQFPENAALSVGATQDYLGALKAFVPDEVRDLLEKAGMRVLRCGGLGSLANLVGKEVVGMAMADETLWPQFVELCERYDLEISSEGIGTCQRAGLMAVAKRAIL